MKVITDVKEILTLQAAAKKEGRNLLPEDIS